MMVDDEIAIRRARKKCAANPSLFPSYEARADTRWKAPKLKKLSPTGELSGTNKSGSSIAFEGRYGSPTPAGTTMLQTQHSTTSAPRLSLPPSKVSLVKSLIHSRVQFSKRFCSWECVKAESLIGVPTHFRYEKEMLVNLAAGYSVD
jgi:hypothetical protein